MNEPILISRREAAKALSISLRKLDYLIAAKEIQCRRIGGRTLIPITALKHFASRDHASPMGNSLDRSRT